MFDSALSVGLFVSYPSSELGVAPAGPRPYGVRRVPPRVVDHSNFLGAEGSSWSQSAARAVALSGVSRKRLLVNISEVAVERFSQRDRNLATARLIYDRALTSVMSRLSADRGQPRQGEAAIGAAMAIRGSCP